MEKEIQKNTSPEGENVKKRWSTRRRIAYISLATGIVILFLTIALAISDSDFATRLGEVMTLLSTGVFALFSLVGAYMGLSSLGKK